MISGGKGGANTKTGLTFEGVADIESFLNEQDGYEVKDGNVFYNNKLVARIFKKYGFYKFLDEYKINWKNHISKRLLPDNCIFVMKNNTLFVIECKFQRVAGSVDEKLQTCDFKKKQYQKLLSNTDIKVEYVYLLSEWFKDKQYADVLEYIESVGCQYYFEHIPLEVLGLTM